MTTLVLEDDAAQVRHLVDVRLKRLEQELDAMRAESRRLLSELGDARTALRSVQLEVCHLGRELEHAHRTEARLREALKGA